MLSRSKKPFFGFILLLLSTLIYGETNGPLNADAHSINLRHAINKTFAHNPALKSFHYQLRAQQGLASQASFAASPELSFVVEDALGTGDFKGTDMAQATLGISWVVEGETRRGFIDEARASTLSLSTEESIKRLDVAAQTARLYLICLSHQARMINADNTLKLASETVSAVHKRVFAGKAPEAELARAEAELAKKQLDREALDHQLSSTIRLLGAQWGETQPGFTQVEGDIFNLPTPLSFETLKNRIEQSPDFLRLLSDKHLRQAQLALMQSQSSPQWRVNLGLRHFEFTHDQALLAGISIPFGERVRNTGRISAAREKLSQTHALQDALRVRIETTLFVLSQQLQHSMHRIDAYQKQIIPHLEAAFKQTRQAYELGRYSYLEWRSVQAELLDARTSLIKDSTEAHLKMIEIERLTGMAITPPADNR